MAEYLITATNQNINIVDLDDAAALRHLYRAMVTSRSQFAVKPPTILYSHDHNSTTSYFTPPGGSRIYPMIVFNSHPVASTSYHEYGHYVGYTMEGSELSGYCPGSGHWFRMTTNEACAWKEGWAEAFDAITHMFWYEREMPALIEEDRNDNELPSSMYGLYQFLDCSQGELFTDRDGEKVEGAVACFFHNLWDDIHLRAPDYQGDNEDLGWPMGYPGSFLTQNLRHSTTGQYSPVFNFMWYGFMPSVKMKYPVTWPYHTQSIYAMYRNLIDYAGVQRAATATVLTITLEAPGLNMQPWRKLQWNHTTEPTSVSYVTENGGSPFYDLTENARNGYVIWRKQVAIANTSAWTWDGRDGRLDKGYVKVATVGQNISQWTDQALLPKGLYSYVVVAYNQSDSDTLSIPKAEAHVWVGNPIRIKKDPDRPLSRLTPGATEYLVIETEKTNPTFSWISVNKPSYLSITGIDSSHFSITNNFQQGVDSTEVSLFHIRCVVTDSSGADTSLAYYPAYTPLETAASLVYVGTPSLFVPDTGLAHGLDFVTQPGTYVTSIHPLQVRPVSDSSGYKISLNGMTNGTLMLDLVRLYAVDHPTDTKLGGSSDSGYYIYRVIDDSVVIDDTTSYGMYDMVMLGGIGPLGGMATAYVADMDTLAYGLGSGDSLDLKFIPDSVLIIVTDSIRAGWSRDFILELKGVYYDSTREFHSIPGPTASSPLQDASGAGHSVAFGLEQNTPNPFSSTTSLSYSIDMAGDATLALYDASGNLLRILAEGRHAPGRYSAVVNLADLPSGVYYYTLSMNSRSTTRSMVLVK